MIASNSLESIVSSLIFNLEITIQEQGMTKTDQSEAKLHNPKPKTTISEQEDEISPFFIKR